MDDLDWGWRYLMCPPTHFAVTYEINPWMHVDRPVDLERAHEQWHTLVATLRAAGAEVELLDPVAGLPDLVFTANSGIVAGDVFVPARFRDRERQPETPQGVSWFAGRGWRVSPLPIGAVQEGAGDALPVGDRLVVGHGPRSSRKGAERAAAQAGFVAEPVELVDARLYHLDLGLCPLGEGRALLAPDAFSSRSRRRLRTLVPRALVLELDDALSFCANSVVVGRTVVMPACPARVGRQLEQWGFDPIVIDVGEFEKAGGACRCLTLALDVPSPVAARRTVAA
jgi:N-dimethylarginine dimethylaminohydrolase